MKDSALQVPDKLKKAADKKGTNQIPPKQGEPPITRVGNKEQGEALMQTSYGLHHPQTGWLLAKAAIKRKTTIS